MGDTCREATDGKCMCPSLCERLPRLASPRRRPARHGLPSCSATRNVTHDQALDSRTRRKGREAGRARAVRREARLCRSRSPHPFAASRPMRELARLTLVLGGARSGKSRHAEALLHVPPAALALRRDRAGARHGDAPSVSPSTSHGATAVGRHMRRRSISAPASPVWAGKPRRS